ncbi:MAG: hypothetical protein KAQ68_09285 [Clostridiales bacterium]|nr:hypothetical protein [Clostridiales bacterium]
MKKENNTSIIHISDLPRTGRIGRFIKILEKQVDEDTLLMIAEGAISYDTMNDAQKAAWWKGAIEKMENILGKEVSVEIMHQCGAK